MMAAIEEMARELFDHWECRTLKPRGWDDPHVSDDTRRDYLAAAIKVRAVMVAHMLEDR